MLKIRLNIAYAIFKISRFFFNFIEKHIKVIIHIIYYFKNTINFKLTYFNNFKSLKGYLNIDWKNNKNIKKLTFNYSFNINNTTIS